MATGESVVAAYDVLDPEEQIKFVEAWIGKLNRYEGQTIRVKLKELLNRFWIHLEAIVDAIEPDSKTKVGVELLDTDLYLVNLNNDEESIELFLSMSDEFLMSAEMEYTSSTGETLSKSVDVAPEKQPDWLALIEKTDILGLISWE